MKIVRRLDACDSVANWTGLGNDTSNLVTSTSSVSGKFGISFDKVDGAANTVNAGVSRIIDSWSFKDGIQPADELVWYLYLSDLSDVAYSWIRLGTDASNYVEYRFDDSRLTAGAFSRCHVPLYFWEASVGQMDFSDIRYLASGVAFDSESDALAGIILDRIAVAEAGSVSSSVGDSTSIKGRANITLPDAVDDGDDAPLSVDAYGRLELRSYDRDSNSLLITPVADNPRGVLGPVTVTTLTAPGSSVAFNVLDYPHILWQVTVASVDTSVDVRIEGSNDDAASPSSWYNLDEDGADTQYTANGTYRLRATSECMKWTRFTFVSEDANTAVTLALTLTAAK